MKLISCHIENYGKIKETDYTFADGITQYCEENGYGKTTLASFLKAMFYGLPAATGRTKQFNDRAHFYPFSGGKFGGSLDFEKEGKRYRIERFFDKSSSTKDSLLVYCNGTLTEEFGEDVGRSVFGLDEEAFERTVFVTAAEMDIGSTSGINARLNCYVDNTDSDNNFDSAIKALNEKRKALKADRGNGGLMTAQREEISRLQSEIENFNRIADSLGEQYEERESLDRQIRETEEREKRESRLNLLRQKWETYDGYAAALAEEKEKAAALYRKYPKGLPTQEQLRDLRDKEVLLESLRERREAASLGGEEQARMEALSGLFAEGVPSEEALAQAEEQLSQIGSLRVQLEELKKGAQSGRQKELSDKFSDGVPDEKEWDELQKLLAEYQEKERELDAAKELSLQTGEPVQKKEKRAGGLAAVLALVTVLLLAGGAALLTGGQNRTLGVLLLGLGAAAFVGAIFLFLRQRGSAAAGQAARQEALVRLQKEFTDSKDEIRERLARYGYYSRNGVAYDFAMLQREAEEYEDFRKEAERAREVFEERAQTCRDLLERAATFLERYTPDAEGLRENFRNMQTAFRKLREEVLDYNRLKQAEEKNREKKASCIGQEKEVRAQMQAVLSAYDMELSPDLKEQLEIWGADRNEAEHLKKAAAEQEKRLEEYKVKNGLFTRPEGEVTDTGALQEEQSLRRRRLAEIDNQIADAENLLERLPEKQNELTLAEEKLEEYRETHFIYTEAIAALQTAEQNLKDKYIAPVKERFCKYSEAIEKAIGEKVTMDKDFRITFERGGENRKDRHLSAGERSICALCFRLALIDNMYETEQPFIIMDDPFVHLDAAHMERTGRVLRELAKDRQILYFCCHESRKAEAV